jgi:hypothetical protein
MMYIPFDQARDPVWQHPFNAAALFLPSALDSCFTLLGKLAKSRAGSSAGSKSSSSGPNMSSGQSRGGSSAEGHSSSRVIQFGKGGSVALNSQELVRAFVCALLRTAIVIVVTVTVAPTASRSHAQQQRRATRSNTCTRTHGAHHSHTHGWLRHASVITYRKNTNS